MTNLVEKLLITGFGIFILISFLFIISPFTDLINEYDDSHEKLDKILTNINDIDQSIEYISIYHNESYFKEIETYTNFNITIMEYKIQYNFILNQEWRCVFSNYKIRLSINNFQLISEKKYLLNLSYKDSLIDINFILIE